MQTLYRKYRPQDFSEIFGQKHIVKVIQKQVEEDKVGHAYLFTGSRGTGKTSMARLLAKAVNCEKPKRGNPCKKCYSCRAIEKGRFLDLVEIDAASNRGIDEIRRLKERVGFSPSEGKKKVYIIDEVHMLTKDAFNALLKTLEEPPDHAIFILATTEPHKVLMTIISRCQRFNFILAEDEVVIERLKYICKQEGVKFEDEALEAVAKNSGGSFRDSESILEKVLGAVGVKSDNEVNFEDVRDILGLAESEEIILFVEKLLEKDTRKALEIFDSFVKTGVNIYQFIRQTLEYLRQLMIKKISKQKGNFFLSDLVEIISQLSEAERKLKGSQVKRLPVEVAIVKICENEQLGNSSGTKLQSQKKQREKKDEVEKKEKNVVKIVKNAMKFNKKNDSGKGKRITLVEITERWEKIIDDIRPFNHHLSAFFRKAKPVKLSKGVLTLNVPFRFHKQRIESTKGQQAFGEVVQNLFGQNLKCICEIVEEDISEKIDSEDEDMEKGEVVFEVLGDMIE